MNKKDERKAKTRMEIMDAVRKIGIATISEIAKETGYHRNTVKRYLKEAAESGILSRKLVGQTTVFWLRRVE